MTVKDTVLGVERERMPGMAFRIMSFMMKFGDLFSDPGKRMIGFGIHKGQTVIDYGCGPGRYLPRASELVGDTGIVYGADIHELSIAAVNKLIRKYNFENVIPLKIEGYHCPLEAATVDLIYALDMFHMIQDTDAFLKELHRLLKKDGILIMEDGHQPRAGAREKILKSKQFTIIEENRQFQKCRPTNGF